MDQWNIGRQRPRSRPPSYNEVEIHNDKGSVSILATHVELNMQGLTIIRGI